MAQLAPQHEVVLDFENQTLIELLSEDGLVIMARGLGLDRLFLKFLKLYCDPHNLVLVLNASSLESFLTEELCREGVEYPLKCITNEYSAKEREGLYLQGGVVCITSRILVVDFLRGQCPIDKVTGILVFNGHRVKDSSTEAFILRLYREKNKAGFIKSFSDAPEPFTNGFCQLERVMRNLFLRHVYLWPRFHATVSASLSRHKPDVVELRQAMTPHMVAIQMAVLDIMKACVSELKRSQPSLDTEEVTVENCMNKSFNQIIKLQLDPIWNQLGGKTKQLVFDLRTLRTLLHFLTQYDCVTFYNYLETIRSSTDTYAFSGHSSWLFMDSADTLFVKSRERVYGRFKLGKQSVSKDKTSKDDGGGGLEESPKWHLLSMVLEEIRKETRTNEKLEGSSKVLVVANDERTCYQLRQYLCEGGQRLLEKQLSRLNLTVDTTTSKNLKRSLPSQVGGASKKRKTDTVEEQDGDDEGVETGVICQPFLEEEELEMVFSDDDDGRMEAASSHFGLPSGPVIVLHPLSSANDNPYHMGTVLREMVPQFIVMYDADIQFVRQVEVFKACRPGLPLRVYFLLYDSSVEEQRYLTGLRKEKEAFEQLIKDRASMVVPVDREGRVGDNTLLTRELSASQEVSSRKAGGRGQEVGPQSVLVDIREFRSSLPFLIHRRGIDIVPLTLEVGDYILSPDMCVERKSVSDLIGSLNSGRLYNQAVAMTRHYKRPLLLIEFDESRSFSLQKSGSIKGEISSQSVASKLALLTLHFPTLRILWCPTPNATAELLEQLKVGQGQPDVEVALSMGQDSLDKVEGDKYNPLVKDFLLKLPGINSKNYRRIMNKIGDLQELVSLSEGQLDRLLDNDANAKLLWSFLHTQSKVTTTTRGKKRT
ncbi:DNA repair endonuclease XPF-like [Halichondria panicea]|uniref:DNA repair endonuclease XPF-like n=1 Tax=Halichondria panicea TaxID=6063 RepID=UPI00312B3629